jgi:DNA (cytosine-5)-methyltransferase 1
MTKLSNSPELSKIIPFKIGTMCSGIGSPEQALKELDIPHENVFACEKDKFARQTYLANFTPGIMLEDMTMESWIDPGLYADIVVAGIPCQSFSLAGKRQGENDPRGLLIYDFIRYVKNQRPKVFIIENVKGLLSDASGKTFGKWLELLGCSRNGQPNMFNHPGSLGYNLHYRVLNAKHYGLPQNRERVFIIGIRSDLPSKFVWPKRVVLKDRLIDLLESEVDEKYHLSESQIKNISKWKSNQNPLDNIFEPDDIMSSVLARGDGETHAGMKLINVDSINKRIHTFKETENNIRAVRKDGSGCQEAVYHKENGILNTLSISHVPKVITNNLRVVTPRECMRFQGFSDDYIISKNDTIAYKQAGNSIPVHMMKAILRQLLPILKYPHPQIIPRC